ncbi:BlaI/MecI/CopY family transcriptional regulator [Anaerovorax odorimutans]|uniref:BlaI/MecI/CopY family transcriptional regulator n=1 Tax=Anaerovorax odorimutans TaxID=109327 RepID=UPI000429B58B|nr:BlaI/MecI/CopY family transcriptional regulator [Anaerovorax odorimutans]
MNGFNLGKMENKFADLIWKSEPISSGELVKLCEKNFDWKKSTTYTMLKRLCEKNIFKNDNGIVISLISKEDFQTQQGELFLKGNFSGSLPKFVAAFIRRNKLSKKEIEELKKLIENSKEE